MLGYKFETISTIPDNWDSVSRKVIENRENMVVDNHAQYCSVARTGIGKIRLIIGGEVDACKYGRLYMLNVPLTSSKYGTVNQATNRIPSTGLNSKLRQRSKMSKIGLNLSESYLSSGYNPFCSACQE